MKSNIQNDRGGGAYLFLQPIMKNKFKEYSPQRTRKGRQEGRTGEAGPTHDTKKKQQQEKKRIQGKNQVFRNSDTCILYGVERGK